MRLKQKLPAAVIAVLLAATWAVPATISQYVEPPHSTVGAHDVATLEGISGSEVQFQAPEGWTTTPASDPNVITYTKKKDSQELTVTVVGDSRDFDTTADRVLREQSVGGTSAAFDGETVQGGGGFVGKSCVAVKPSVKATGPCAVVHHGKTVVAVIATSTSTEDAPDVQGVVDSLKLTKEGME